MAAHPPELLDEDELLEDELDDELLLDELELPPLTIPHGAGCPLQVLLPIQLLEFSQPQPESMVWQSGYKVPYQLHWPPALAWPEELLDELDELLVVELVEELDDDELLLELEEELLLDVEALSPPIP